MVFYKSLATEASEEIRRTKKYKTSIESKWKASQKWQTRGTKL